MAFATDQAERNCEPSDIDTFLYQIQVGDTIFSIARNTNTTVDEIAALNCLNLGRPNYRVGDLLRIPVSSASAAVGVVEPTARPLNPINSVPVIPYAPEPQGCNAFTRLYQPMNGQVINAPITVEAMVEHADFAQARIEILGPSTNGQWVTIATIPQATVGAADIGQFVPSLYEAGEYQFALQTFSSLGNLVGTCRVTVYISDAPSQDTTNLMPVVIALQDIPLGTTISADMVSLAYWPNELAMDYASANAGQWYLGSLEDVIGQQSRTLIPALAPVASQQIGEYIECPRGNAGCMIIADSNNVALVVYTHDLAAVNYSAGQAVDIVVSIPYQLLSDENLIPEAVNSDEHFIARSISNAIVLRTELLHPEGEPIVTLMLAMPPQDATVLQWMDDAGLPYLFVPHLEGAETIALDTTVVPSATAPVEEITAFYPIAEDFVGDYDAIATDARALFMAVMPNANQPHVQH